MNSTRSTHVPNISYRHPITGQQIICGEQVDVEQQCLEQAGQMPADVLARMRELTSQSAQNRHRIVKRLLGVELVPPVTTRRSK